MSDDIDAMVTIRVKKYGAGHAELRATGPKEFAAAAERAWVRSLTCLSVILPDQFRESMREAGAPDEVIEAFLHGAWLDDEAYLTVRPG